MTLSPTQTKTLRFFADAFAAGETFLTTNDAIGGWSADEKDIHQSASVGRGSLLFVTVRGANINTICVLRNAGLIKHVRDGFHMITEAGLEVVK